MLRFLAVLSCISLVFCIQHPLVAEQVHHDDFQAEQARDLLKHVLGNAEGDVYELKEGELGFSWDNCGISMLILHAYLASFHKAVNK